MRGIKTFQPFLLSVRRTLNSRISYSYVKDRDLDVIRAKYDPENSMWQKTKMYGHIFQHIGFQGFKNFRKDVKAYMNLRFKKDLDHD